MLISIIFIFQRILIKNISILFVHPSFIHIEVNSCGVTRNQPCEMSIILQDDI